MVVKALTDKELAEAIKSRQDNTPLPSGISWNPGGVPQFLSSEEAAEYDATGVMPKSAQDRAAKELKLIPRFDADGHEIKKAATE